MARKQRKKGGARYKRVVLSLPKRLYYVLNGIALVTSANSTGL